MGNFWGSVQLRTEDRDHIQRVLEDLARASGERFYLGPAIKGWIGVYPNNNGQDFSIGDAVATATRLDAFHLLLHDDDIFAYRFYREGNLADEYNSTPGYFSESDRAAEEPLTGEPARYAHLLTKSPLVVKKLLSRDRESGGAFWEMERFEQFARLLGIANAMTAYEYLEQGEWEGIKHRRRFTHIPDKAPEKQAERDQANATRGQIEHLKSTGLLLAAYPTPKNGWITWSTDALTGGFLLHSGKPPSNAPTPIVKAAAPWPRKPEAVDIPPAQPGMGTFAVSPSGEIIAIQTGGPEQTRVEFWNRNDREMISQLPGWHGHGFRFTPDSSSLLINGRENTILVSVATGQITRSIPTSGAQRAIVHPQTGDILIDQQINLLLAGRDSNQQPTEIFLGGASAPAASLMGQAQATFARIDLEKMEQTMRAELEKNFEHMAAMMKKHAGKKGMPAWDEAQAATLRRETEKQMEQYLEGIRKAKRGESILPAQQARERLLDFAFSADGTLLFCATHFGLRVYDWPAIRSGSPDAARVPKYSFNIEMQSTHTMPYPAQCNTVAEDPSREHLLFGAMNGVLYTMDLRDGRVISFREMPERAPIVSMGLSGGRSALGCLCRPELAQHLQGNVHQPFRPVFYVWDLAHLASG